MGKRSDDDPPQLQLFLEPGWADDSGVPVGTRGTSSGRRRLSPRPASPDPQDAARRAGQLGLFQQLPERVPSPRQLIRHRLRGRKAPQTYLELAQALGLLQLQALLKLPATYYFLDARPLQRELQVESLLDARYRVVDHLMDAFDDVADLSPMDVRVSRFTLWAGRHFGVPTAVSPRGEALSLAIAAPDARVEDPFRLRLRGLPGYLGYSRGPSPLEEGEELLSLYDREVLYTLLPLEAQPTPLEALLLG